MYSKVYNWYNPKKIISLIRYVRLKKFEERVLRKFVYCTAPSSKEAAVLRKMSPNSVVIEAPNGVDLDHFRIQPLVRNSLDLLFTGDLSYVPNLDAVKWFISRVIPLIKEGCPNVRLLHIGKGGELLDKFCKTQYKDSYFSMGYQEDIIDILKRSSIFINPMRSGAGVRLKVLEAMALGKVVISTSIGAEGINISDDAVVIADTPEDMAREIINIIQDLKTDCSRSKRITASARKIVEEHYSWNNTLKGIIDIIDSKK
jgi:glycosyltransferase involved in cell wall biosynthesis